MAAVKGLSDPLYAMINNGTMKESISGVVSLQDVDVDIFEAFFEFAYTGNYDSMLGTLTHEDPDVHQEMADFPKDDLFEDDDYSEYFIDDEGEEEDDDGGLDMRISWKDFCRYKYGASPKSEWCKYPDLSFHVRVYGFATRYLIEPLRQRCLEYLQRGLSDFKELTDDNSQRILDLFAYTYVHGIGQEPKTEPSIRELISYYMACKFSVLSKNEKFASLLKSNTQISSDLIMAMAKWGH